MTSGYAGGTAETANYEAVSTGRTGHAESVKIVYDPRKISYEELLKVHFATHDPRTLNRQGNDIGPQYRSAVFYADEEQKRSAEAMIADLDRAGSPRRPIVTTLEPLVAFYPAEAHHQDYVACHLQQPYVKSVALPKVAKVRAKFKDLVKSPAEATSARIEATAAVGSFHNGLRKSAPLSLRERVRVRAGSAVILPAQSASDAVKALSRRERGART